MRWHEFTVLEYIRRASEHVITVSVVLPDSDYRVVTGGRVVVSICWRTTVIGMGA